MIIGLPLTASGEFSPHFGAASQVGLFTIDVPRRRILRGVCVAPPCPQPCGWADWLGAQGVQVVLAGAIGRGAVQRMNGAGIRVVTGIASGVPALLVQSWLNGTIVPGESGCRNGAGATSGGLDEGCCCTT